MAKVNRFFQSPGVQQVRAIGLEEAMVLPSYMRQKHDAIAGAAAQMSVLDSASMEMDQKAVRQILDPIEEEVANLSSDLAKNGYDPQKAEQLMNVQAQYQKAKRDGLAKIEGRLQSYQAEKKKIEEFYKENPEYAQHFSGLLSMANRGKATVDENGDVQVPGVKTPEYSKVLSSQEITDMTTQLFNAMEPEIRALNLDISSVGDLYDVFTDQSVTGIKRDKIMQLFDSALNSMPELQNSFKVKKSLAGVGLSQYADPETMSKEQVENIVNNDMSIIQSTLDNQLTAGKSLIRGRIANQLMNNNSSLSEDKAYAEADKKVAESEEYKAMQEQHDVALQQAQIARQQGNYSAIGKTALNTSARYEAKMTLTGIAGGLAYQNRVIDRRSIKTRPDRNGDVNNATNILRNLIPTDIVYGSKGMNSTYKELTGDSHQFEYDRDGNLITVKPSEEYLQTIGDKQYFYVNKKTGETVSRSTAIHPKSGFDSTKFEKKYVTPEELTTDSNKFQPLKELRNNIPNNENYSDRQLIEGYQAAINDNDHQVLKSFRYYDDKDKDLLSRANETMLGIDDNGKVTRSATATNLSNFQFPDGQSLPFSEVMDRLGFDVDNEVSYSEFAEKVKPRITGYIPQLGRYSVNVTDEDGRTQSVLMQPDDTRLKNLAKPSTALYNFAKSGQMFQPMDGQNGNPYLPSDVEGHVLVAYNDMAGIYNQSNRNTVGYIEVPKDKVSSLNFKNIGEKIQKGEKLPYNFISQEEIDRDALEASVHIINR